MTDARQKIAPGAPLKQVMWNKTTALVGLIDNGSSGCLLRTSAAALCVAELTKDTTALYGFGDKGTPSASAIGKCYPDIKIDAVAGKKRPFSWSARRHSVGRSAHRENMPRATLRGLRKASWLFPLLVQK